MHEFIPLFENSSLVVEFAMIFFGAMMLAIVFLLIKQPIILAYIVAGVILGPLGLRVITDTHVIEELSHLGIIFLMFLLGINLSPNKFFSLIKRTAPIVLIASSIFVLLFTALAFLFLRDFSQALIVGSSLIFSSTIIGIKLTPTTVVHQKHEGAMLISILLLQDLIAIMLIVFLYGTNTGSVVFSTSFLLFKLILFVMIAFFVIRYIVLPLQTKFAVIQDFIFLLAIGWCLTLAQVASMIGLSYEIGAFVAGFSLATSPIALFIVEGLKPLREFFLIIFFFSIGAEVNISILTTILLPASIVAVVLIASKYLVYRILFRMRHEFDRSTTLSLRLSQASEFSILVAYGAQQANRITEDTALFMHIITLITFIISTYLIVGFCKTPISNSDKRRAD